MLNRVSAVVFTPDHRLRLSTKTPETGAARVPPFSLGFGNGHGNTAAIDTLCW